MSYLLFTYLIDWLQGWFLDFADHITYIIDFAARARARARVRVISYMLRCCGCSPTPARALALVASTRHTRCARADPVERHIVQNTRATARGGRSPFTAHARASSQTHSTLCCDTHTQVERVIRDCKVMKEFNPSAGPSPHHQTWARRCSRLGETVWLRVGACWLLPRALGRVDGGVLPS